MSRCLEETDLPSFPALESLCAVAAAKERAGTVQTGPLCRLGQIPLMGGILMRRTCVMRTGLLVWLWIALPAYAADLSPQGTARVSVDSSGAEANAKSYYPSLSADGRFVAFMSRADNLVPGDTNRSSDIFVHDRQTGQTTRVSVDSSGAEANGDSDFPSLSADGRFVAFESYADNLIPSDTNYNKDIFVHDRQTGQTTRVSVSSSGAQGYRESLDASISADGRFVAFVSWADNLVSGDTNYVRDIFVHDRQTGQTTRVSVDSAGVQGNGVSDSPSISADGRFVAFVSWSDNLVPGDTNLTGDIFVHDRQTGQTTRVSVDSAGVQANNRNFYPSISADGRFVAFGSWSDNLVPGDTNLVGDIFVHDRQTGQTTRVSVDSAAVQGNRESFGSSISADGRFVAFTSWADNLVPGDTNGYEDVFVHGGPVLSATGTCPGVMTFTASGATPGGQVAFVWGTATGGFLIPGGYPCSPTQLDLVPLLAPPPGYALAVANALGEATASGTVPPSACGVVVMQALDLASCSKTNTVPM